MKVDEITFNFRRLEVKFFLHGKLIIWKVIQYKDITVIFANDIAKGIAFHCLGFMIHISTLATEEKPVKLLHKQTSPTSIKIHDDLQAISDSFAAIFSALCGLPPQR